VAPWSDGVERPGNGYTTSVRIAVRPVGAGGSRLRPAPWTRKGESMSLLLIILIIVVVLALLGFFGRSYW
jgi:hypothetical protein